MSDAVELDPNDPRATVCGTCGRGWDDSVSTSVTPTPAGRCPFEYDHEYEDEPVTMRLLHMETPNKPLTFTDTQIHMIRWALEFTYLNTDENDAKEWSIDREVINTLIDLIDNRSDDGV